MRKGIYSATIALTALVLAVAIIANTGQMVGLEEEKMYSSAMIKVKAQWQNSRFVLDKAASDAIADSTHANGCNYDEDMAGGKTHNYFTTLLGEMREGECHLSDFELSGPANNIQINATIDCLKYYGDAFSVRYKKSAIFNKEVATDNTSGCTIDVMDKQSGACEVDLIPDTLPAVDLCSQ